MKTIEIESGDVRIVFQLDEASVSSFRLATFYGKQQFFKVNNLRVFIGNAVIHQEDTKDI